MTGFIHDTNPGMGPEVSTVDSGNGFGTRVFWTAVIPDRDVQVNPGAGTAEMHVRNLPELDYYSPTGNAALLSLGPTWQTGYFASTVSFDVVWNGPVMRRVNVKDAADGFAGTFNENQATVTWSTSSSSGFTFTSNPGDFSTSVPETPGVNGVTAPLNFFAEVGHERNGIFFPASSRNSVRAIANEALPILSAPGEEPGSNRVSASISLDGKSSVTKGNHADYGQAQLPSSDLKQTLVGSSARQSASTLRAARDLAFARFAELVGDPLEEIGHLSG